MRIRSRTASCPHGFLIPGKPDPWTIPVAKGGAEVKASLFCRKCWEGHGDVFVSRGYPPIQEEDPCSYDFLHLIDAVLSAHAWFRDQDRYEYLETELRVHLWAKRAVVEDKLHQNPVGAVSYVRKLLKNKLIDLQRSLDARAEQSWISYDAMLEAAVPRGCPDVSADDENEWPKEIMDSAIVGQESTDREDWITADAVTDEDFAAERQEPLPRTVKGREKEDAELVRAAIERQSHRIDPLEAIIQREEDAEISKAWRQVVRGIDSLSPDESKIISMRYLNESTLRTGKPRPRADIRRELRLTNDPLSGLSAWGLEMQEQRGVLKLRSLVQLPSSFKNHKSVSC